MGKYLVKRKFDLAGGPRVSRRVWEGEVVEVNDPKTEEILKRDGFVEDAAHGAEITSPIIPDTVSVGDVVDAPRQFPIGDVDGLPDRVTPPAIDATGDDNVDGKTAIIRSIGGSKWGLFINGALEQRDPMTRREAEVALADWRRVNV